MKKSYIKILCLEFFVILVSIMNMILFKDSHNFGLINIAIWSLINIILLILVGIEKDRNLYKIDTVQVVFVTCFIYIIFTYILGIFVGYTKSPFDLTFFNIIKNVLPIIFLIILQELFRYNIITKCSNKLGIILIIIIFSGINIAVNFEHYPLTDAMGVFELIGILVLPTIANNCLLTFITKKSGIVPAVIYRIINECIMYVVPITPDLNIYINSVFQLILPTIIFLKFNNMYAKEKFITIKRSKRSKRFINTLVFSFVLVIVVLVSGAFKYYAMAIGSNSMHPKIKKGDAIIIEKIKDNPKNIEKGVIIAYSHNKTIIVHRINKIDTKNNKYIITTKGDNNDNVDNWEVYKSDIIGIVRFKVPLVGWPSVWLSEILK